MNTPFGGTVRHEGSATREALPPALASALAAAFTRAHPAAEGLSDDDARVVSFDLDGGDITYAADLSSASPWEAAGLPHGEALGQLARVGRTLAALHARGVVHGDVRPELLAVDWKKRVALLTPARASAPGAVLRARLHPGGAGPGAVAWASPEVIAGADATPASDVYGLAAVAYATLTGAAPAGQVNLQHHAAGRHGDLARAIAAALDASPAARPAMDALAAALDRAAAVAAAGADAAGAPYRGAAPTDGPAAPPARETSPVLLLTLLGGGLITFVGAVMLVSIGWEVAGALGRVALLAAMSAGAWGLGAVARRYDVEVGVVVARAASGIFATVAVAFAFSQLDEPGRLALLCGLTVAAFAGGAVVERRGAPVGGAVLVGLGTQLLWAVGAQVIHMGDGLHGDGPVALLAGVVAAVTCGVALHRRSTALTAVAALDAAAFAAALGAYLHTGSVMGPPGYALAVAAGYAVLAAAAARRGPDTIAWPFALAAGVASLASAALGVDVMGDRADAYRTVGALWPYGVALAAVPLARGATPLGLTARFVAGVLVVTAPTVEALVRETFFTTLVAAVMGAAVLGASLTAPWLRRGSDARPEWILAGLFGMLCTPDLRLAGVIARREYAEGGDPARWWALVAAVAVGLVVTGRAVTGRVGRANHRLLEGAGALSLLGGLTLQVLSTREPAGPALAALGVSGALAAYGFAARRAVPLLAGAGAFVVHAWVQYFVRLADVLPTSIRLVGFGVGLLAGGVLYEQQLRPRAAALRDWN